LYYFCVCGVYFQTQLLICVFVFCNIVTISAADESGFTGFLLRTNNHVGTFSVSSDDTRTACSVKYTCLFSSMFRIHRVRKKGAT